MIRNAWIAVMLTACANIASAQDFPVWERLLRHYSGKTDETPRAFNEDGQAHADVAEVRSGPG